VIVAAVAAALGSFAAGRPYLGGAALAIWFVFTFRFFTRRLYGTARTASHVAEMLVTSLAIPFVAVFWRLYGAVRYRVLFW
jgi:hypothetical protein